MIISRRKFLVGASAALIAAPAIVRIGSLMPVKVIRPEIKKFTGVSTRMIWVDTTDWFFYIDHDGQLHKYHGENVRVASAT